MFTVKYNCTGCGHKWQVRQPRKGLIDACPECSKKQAAKGVDWEAAYGTPYTPTNHIASRAVDATYRVVEGQGFTNMKDNMREGDVAVSVPNPVSDAVQKQGGFFGGGNPQQVISGRGSAMEMASAARAERQSQGIGDAFGTAMKSIKGTPSVIDRTRANPYARAKS